MTPSPTSRTPWLLLGLLTAAAMLLHGYHYGVQDQAIYLPAVKQLLNPALYPHDSAFFLSQTRWTWFDEIMAASVRIAIVSLELRLLIWHVLTVFAALLGCWRIAARCFATPPERWGAVLMVAAVLALPATGTQAPLLDNYVHPRNFATAAILLALAAALDRRLTAILWLALGAMFHPLMAAIGAVHIAIMVFWNRDRVISIAAAAVPLLAVPLGPAAWREVLETRRHLFPLRWAWYEWLGVVVPLLFLFWFSTHAIKHSQPTAARVSRRIAVSTAIFIAVAILVSVAPALETLIPAQPMRGMHLAFLLFFFFLGGWLGGAFCKTNLLRWTALLLPVCLAMSCWQWRTYPATPHIEFPGAASRNEWVQAFDWVRANTRPDALFALDPMHMESPGNDSHGFRALAERSMLADYTKDRAVAALSPDIAVRWLAEWQATEAWRSFGPADFAALRQKHGVTWLILSREQSGALECPWRSENLAVCQIQP